MKKNKKSLKIRHVIITHVSNNSKEYIVTSIIFVIGIFLGVLFINNMQSDALEGVKNYLNAFIEQFKNIETLDNLSLLKTSIINNLIIVLCLWFFGTTVIGIPIVFGLLLYRGFCLGYAIAICILTMGLFKGLVFVLCNMVFQNLLFIPIILAVSVSGIKLYKSIIKDKRRDNIKGEIARHTIFSCFMAVIICISSVVEVFLSDNLLKLIAKYL